MGEVEDLKAAFVVKDRALREARDSIYRLAQRKNRDEKRAITIIDSALKVTPDSAGATVEVLMRSRTAHLAALHEIEKEAFEGLFTFNEELMGQQPNPAALARQILRTILVIAKRTKEE